MMMPRGNLLIFLGITVISILPPLYSKSYIWTDVNGQKIEAEFVRSSSSTLTISIEGQELDLPLDSLSAFSKALALKLRNQNEPPTVQPKKYPWKDLQGRVIEAEFISATSTAVKLLWNGQTFELTLSSLSQESKNLARKLANPTPSIEPPPSQASVTVPKPSTEETGTDPNGPLDLDSFHVWISADGRALRAKYIEYAGGELTVLTSSEQEVQIDQENLSSQAIALAKKLKAFNDERKKAIKAFAAMRKKMKVPAVSEQDLDKAHQFKNTDGVTISANFIDADDYGVTITLAGKTQPLELTWDRFNRESQALLEALRRKSLTANRAPKTIPAKGGKIGYFANGPFKGYNTVFQSERFNAAISSTGSSIKIWLKNSKAPSKPPKTFGISFGTRYTDTSNPEKHRRRSRKITGFENPPDASTQREKTTISGTFNNGGTFQYDVQFNDKGVTLWSKMKDPSGEKEPTSIRIGTSIPGIVPNSRNLSMKEIMPYIGDGSLVLKPAFGKTRHYPFKEKWAITNTKYKGQKFGGMESASLMGSPYGNRISFMATGSGMSFGKDVAYGKIFPFQGLSLTYSNGSSPKVIPQNRAYRVLILPL